MGGRRRAIGGEGDALGWRSGGSRRGRDPSAAAQNHYRVSYQRRAGAGVCPDDAAVALAGGRAGRLTVSLRGWDAAATLEGPLAAEPDRVVPLLNAVVATGVRRLIVEVSAIGGASPWLPELLMSVGRQLEDRGGWLITFGEAVRLDLVDPPLDEVFRAYRGVADPRPG